MSEILDRYTITMLKSERTSEDVSEELKTYKEEIDNLRNGGWLSATKMKVANEMWGKYNG